MNTAPAHTSQNFANIYDELVSMGIEHGSHESDLYVPVTDETTRLIAKHKIPAACVSTFVDARTKSPWYDIKFQFQPFWNNRAKESLGRKK